MRFARHAVPISLLVALIGASGCSSDSPSGATTSVSASTPATSPSSAGETVPDSAVRTSTVDSTTESTVESSTDESSTDESTVGSSAPETSAPETSTAGTELAADETLAGMQAVIETLASDELNGRDNLTADSTEAQDFLITQLSAFAQPVTIGATGPDAYKQPFAEGVNLVGVIPGTDLADQYVIVGAHYDHVGNDCRGDGTDDQICNGATDNAAGSAVALAVGRAIAGGGTPPRRSVVIALWDAEEDGLLGSVAYVASPIVPLAQTVAYVNFDIQGTNISPSLRNITVMVGTETGGPNLVASALAATQASSLETVPLSLLFGQGRSDHATFVGAGVPSVFFTDATPPCYHTVGDEISIVDFAKLVQQQLTAQALVTDLANTDSLPTFDGAAPPASYADAVAMLDIVTQAQPDFARFSDADRATADQFVADLAAIVAAGAEAFDAAAVGTLLGGAVAIVGAWSNGECDGFLEASSSTSP